MNSQTCSILSRSNRKRGEVQHLRVQTACVSYFKPFELISKIIKSISFMMENSKAFACKLRDNTTHSKGLMTWYRYYMSRTSPEPPFYIEIGACPGEQAKCFSK